MAPPRSALEGWPLLTSWAALLGAMSALIFALVPDQVDAVRQLIRATAATSLLAFLLAFTASSANRLHAGPLPAWQRPNRRQLGLAFALSHALHLVGIIAYARLAPELFWEGRTLAGDTPAMITYLFILALALTSFDTTARLIGPRAWKLLHSSGVWVIWLTFTIAYGKRIAQSGTYALPVMLLLAAAVLRLALAWRKRRWSRTV